MASRWLRWSRRPSDEAQDAAALSQLTSTFLDMDRRQSIAESAVDAAAAFSPRADLQREWDAVQNACYDASAVYLGVAGRSSSDPEGGPPATGAEIAHAAAMLESARAGLDAFYDRHRSVLDSATNKVLALTSEVDAAIRSAHDARQRQAAAEPQLQDYPSVRHARDQLDAAAARLQEARDRTDLAATRKGVEQVRLTSAALLRVLDEAPQRAEQARRTVASVGTRLDAVRTRAAGVPPLISSLLREFNAKSSADLVDTEKVSRGHIERAEALHRQAVAARDANLPEDALDFAKQARTELAAAERHVDDVGDRLAELRAIRAEPEQRARDVRFRLRDAQRLAVDRGVVPEWGSVLDAQAARIDRIVDDIGGTHPDYWAYQRSLGEVSEFIANVVSRIRQGAAR